MSDSEKGWRELVGSINAVMSSGLEVLFSLSGEMLFRCFRFLVWCLVFFGLFRGVIFFLYIFWESVLFG